MIKFNSASHRPARQYYLKERSENLRIGISSKKQSKNAIKQRQHNIQKDSSLDNRLHTFFNLLRTIAGDVGLRKVQDRVAGEEANVNLKRCKYARKYGNSDMISLIIKRVRYWGRHGWVVDGHITNSPQVVMKRRVGYVDEKPEVVRPIWASAPGC